MSQVRSQVSSASPSSQLDPEEEKRLELQVWVEVVGGKKKGRLYGAGDLASNCKKGFTRILDTSGASTSNNQHSQESEETVELKRRLTAAEENIRQMEHDRRWMMARM